FAHEVDQRLLAAPRHVLEVHARAVGAARHDGRDDVPDRRLPVRRGAEKRAELRARLQYRRDQDADAVLVGGGDEAVPRPPVRVRDGSRAVELQAEEGDRREEGPIVGEIARAQPVGVVTVDFVIERLRPWGPRRRWRRRTVPRWFPPAGLGGLPALELEL